MASSPCINCPDGLKNHCDGCNIFRAIQAQCSDSAHGYTNGDYIRMMSDEELAQMFESMLSNRDHKAIQVLADHGISVSLVETPVVNIHNHLVWLQQAYKPYIGGSNAESNT